MDTTEVLGFKEDLRTTCVESAIGPERIGTQLKVAYIMSRFPKLTETFVLYEMLALEKQGIQVVIYPLLKARKTATHPEGGSLWRKLLDLVSKPQGDLMMHPEAVPLVERANYQPFLSWPILQTQFRFLLSKPKEYVGTLWTVVRRNWGSWNYLLGVLAIFPKAVYFAQLMRSEDVSHVHAHFANHPAAAAYIIGRLVGIPFSFTAHGADLQVDQHMLYEKVAEAAFVVTISNFNKEFILEKCGEQFREKVHTVYCGVDTQVFQPSQREDSQEKSVGPLNILCIGTLYEVKGHTYLIEACRLLMDRGVDFACNLVGDGPDRPLLMKQVEESGLSGRVIFHGQLERPEIVGMLRRADVFTLPSVPTDSGRREGIPVVLMEAMASGLPVVSSDISGIPELVESGSSGLLVPPRNSEALADSLEQLSKDPDLRKKLGKAGRAKVNQEFDLFTNASILAAHFAGEDI